MYQPPPGTSSPPRNGPRAPEPRITATCPLAAGHSRSLNMIKLRGPECLSLPNICGRSRSVVTLCSSTDLPVRAVPPRAGTVGLARDDPCLRLARQARSWRAGCRPLSGTCEGAGGRVPFASVYLTVRGSWSLGVHAGGREQARGICDGPGCRKDSGLGLVTGPDEAGFVGEDDCLDPVPQR
jgi:hypothetical protein